MSLTEARFHDLVDATQQTLEDIFDECDLDIDLESSAGVLTVKFENGSQLIFSPRNRCVSCGWRPSPVVSTSTTTKRASAGCPTRATSN